MIMKASVECVDTISGYSREKKAELMAKIMKREPENIEELISFDEGIFRFGGDLKLTKDELKFKEEMMKIQKKFEKQKPGGAGGEKYDRGDLENLQKKRDKMTRDLEKRMEELKSSRNTNFLIFGIMLFVVIIVVLWQCYSKGGNSKYDMDEDVLKASEVIEKRQNELESEIRKLKRMKKALKKKMLEAGFKKEEIKKIQESEQEEEEEELVRDRGKEEESD